MFRRKVALPEPDRRKIREITRERVLAWTNGQQANPAEGPEEPSSVTPATSDASRQPAPRYMIHETDVTAAATARQLIAVRSDTDHPASSAVGFWWHEVDRALWIAEERIIRVSFTTTDNELIFQVDESLPMEFLSILRDRVENSVVLSETIALTSAENVRVAVRRDQGGDLFVEALYDDGIDPNHPTVIKKVTPVVVRLREVTGAR